jgi:hypothetical protein
MELRRHHCNKLERRGDANLILCHQRDKKIALKKALIYNRIVAVKKGGESSETRQHIECNM